MSELEGKPERYKGTGVVRVTAHAEQSATAHARSPQLEAAADYGGFR